ncbi:MAG: pyruvate:ferredoxin (flavodoxin) oxidoreductase [Acidobacteria bacterium]|nr:pyruvate:ferredoxin (flavodoxin) oxidoreductase [Acidobacteriota bacterium]
MNSKQMVTVDGNDATASVAYRINEVAAIYPITPSSNMGEAADEMASLGAKNIWGAPVQVVEMQSEAGAAGAVHGALQAGALATTFTASQGLLLMIPNMYKIAGELTGYCMHVSARTVATHALSIFGDHSDVMACRQIGFGMLASNSVQEAHDFALIAQAASFDSRIPFLHFFDGFRTSHEVSKIEMLSDDDLRHMMTDEMVKAHRERALTPDRPVLRGSAQNPDVFFQAREACNGFYDACPDKVEAQMKKFGARIGRDYRLFDYWGHPEAERVVILMGSGVETARETVEFLANMGEKVGVIAVRLYRPFSTKHLLQALPKSVKAIAVLDRTKEPGATGDPLYLDVVSALRDAEDEGTLGFAMPKIVGGRYGLSSKEFTASMVKSVFDEIAKEKPKRRFTVGIVDDVTHTSLPWDPEWDIEGDDVVRAVFFGLGADGTVGANKNSIKIIGEETPNYVQGYFVYDSKKSGATTVSHLRFGPRPIRSIYLISKASFVACHQFVFLEKLDMLDYAKRGAVFLLNSPFAAGEVWDRLPYEVQQQIIEKELRFYVIDGTKVAREAGMGGRVNTIMQTAFFALSGVLPREEAIECIKAAIKKTYIKKGEEIVRRNWTAVDMALDHLEQVTVPAKPTSSFHKPPIVRDEAPDFVKKVSAVMLAGKGDLLPVSAFPVDGTWPTATTQWEKRNIALDIPIWSKDFCIQCNKCTMVCPHAAIRAKVYEPGDLKDAPATFETQPFKGSEFKGLNYTIQVAPEDCTGCNLCVQICPGKDKANPKHKAINMLPHAEHTEREKVNYDFFLSIPELDRTKVQRFDVKTTQFYQPLFEYSGACAGCGETPYIKLLTQLYGDRLLIANATGCSSIYGGNLPTTPYAVDPNGRGPAWANSLFEDNAEFGLGFRLAIDAQIATAHSIAKTLASKVGDELVSELLSADQMSEAGIAAQRARVAELKKRLATRGEPEARRLEAIADYFVRKSVWVIGGDGWAYDIGYGGLDHVLSMKYDVNLLVLDTEVYSNTGGQASKATPLGATAKFAAKGKAVDKKDLGLMAMQYGHVYVASIAFGARDGQTVSAMMAADSYDGPSLVIAYSHCIAHGYDMMYGADQQKKAVESGIWPIYRYDPRRIEQGEAPLVVDMAGGKLPVQEYMKNETRFRMIEKIDPNRFKEFAKQAQLNAERRMATYQHIAQLKLPKEAQMAVAAVAAKSGKSEE